MFQKSPKKQPQFERRQSTLAQMALSSIYYALKGQRLEKISGQKTGSKSARMAKLWTFSQGHPIPAFSAKGEPRNIFKKSPKKQPSFQRPKSTLAQMALSSKQYGLKLKRLEKIQAETAALKEPEWPSYRNFSQGHPKPAFSEKMQRGHQGKFFKNCSNSSPRLKGPKALWRKWHYPLISMHLKCKDWRIFWCRKRLRKCPNRPVMAIQARSHKNSIF